MDQITKKEQVRMNYDGEMGDWNNSDNTFLYTQEKSMKSRLYVVAYHR